MRHSPESEPFFFGSRERPLFGECHLPMSGTARGCGVVLCYPMGQEYVLAHRSFRRLSVLLAKAGFPVLRFDYRGCGDSSGDLPQVRLSGWLDDVNSAIVELQNRQAVDRVCLVGLRFGATLAALAGAARGGVDGIVLWDPAPNGRTHINELKDASVAGRVGPATDPEPCVDLSGFPVSRSMADDLAAVDLLRLDSLPAKEMLLATTDPDPDEKLVRHLRAGGARIEQQRHDAPRVWIEDINRVLVPAKLLQSITSWVTDHCG
jgi:pimeloyl-ACP methyl ester carboxylesterase